MITVAVAAAYTVAALYRLGWLDPNPRRKPRARYPAPVLTVTPVMPVLITLEAS